ncbi:replication protein [uncultured Ruminococcus sp.]|uniref:replication protein n=1 Tax=uncultured Ruminococcus sp. TaxID=165186 RepID=UPI002619B541|nr:replication protein [uncultured Ruminococcus sp.]
MANPQKENGFTAIANELLEQLIHFKPTSTQYGIMLFIMRRTYGFQRNYAPMSLSYIAKAMNTSPQVVYKGLRQLKEMNMVEIIPAKRNNPQQIKVQKDWQRWVSPHGVSPVQCISHTVDTGVSHTGDISISHTVDQERNNRKKHKKETYCTCTFFERLWAEYPNKKGKARVTAKSLDAISKIGYAEMHRALERYKKSKPDWQHWQNGSTFFNSGYVDYLDASYAAEVEMEEHNGTYQNADKQQWCTDGLI